ncbi:hypothetical protein V2J09_015773 [Rumex salicifolius]
MAYTHKLSTGDISLRRMHSVSGSVANICCCNLKPVHVQLDFDKNHKISMGKFGQIPTWLSLNNNSTPIEVANQPQSGNVENLHLVSLARQGKVDEAYEYLRKMEDYGVSIDSNSYCLLLEACGHLKYLSLGKMIHERIYKMVEDPSTFLNNCVLQMYCDCGSLSDAQQLFDRMPLRNDFSWSIMISAYSGQKLLKYAFSLFSERAKLGNRPNASIFISILRSILDPSLVEAGKQLHSHVIRCGLCKDDLVSTALVNMYAKCGHTDLAKLVLHQMDEKNEFALTALMVGYTQADKQKEVLDLFSRMILEDSVLDDFVVSIVLKACSTLEDFPVGRQIHGLIVKQGLEFAVSVGTPLVDFYVKCGILEFARKAFDRIAEPNDVSWSALITGYSRAGDYNEAVNSLILARSSGSLNSYIYTSIFQACASLADLNFGSQVHADAIKRGLISYHCGESALVTMYSKCGLLDNAFRAFQSIRKPDAIAWTSIISGCAYHGNATKALQLFKKMQDHGVSPNMVTFIAVFTAFSHSGMVTEAKKCLDSMASYYGVEPTIDHYVCVIDIYSRAGKLKEAFDLINTMPFEPDAMSWKALLGGCWMHKNPELGKIAAENVIQLDPEDTAGYILLFNLYTSLGKWEEAASIRKLMAERNLRKEPGRSWMFVNGQLHQFVVGDRHHPQTEEIYMKLKEMEFDRRDDNASRMLTEDDVVVGCEFPEREEQMLEHSEKLAIAFGLISAQSNKPLLIYKNIRACKHCHDFAKRVSLITEREIVVRDANRFHHFVNGKCSCSDFW